MRSMRVRPRYSSCIPNALGAAAITLYPFVLFSMPKQEALAWRVVHHECVHVRQVRNIGWTRFYVSYAWQWVRSIVGGKSNNEAYLSISFEQEAYDKQGAVVLTDAECAEFGV